MGSRVRRRGQARGRGEGAMMGFPGAVDLWPVFAVMGLILLPLVLADRL